MTLDRAERATKKRKDKNKDFRYFLNTVKMQSFIMFNESDN